MRRAISNLIDNALKHGGTEETLTAEASSPPRIAGQGILRNERGKVFEPFCRIEELRHLETGGVGLGVTRLNPSGHGGDPTTSASPPAKAVVSASGLGCWRAPHAHMLSANTDLARIGRQVLDFAWPPLSAADPLSH